MLKEDNEIFKQQLDTKLNVKICSHPINYYFQDDNQFLSNIILLEVKKLKKVTNEDYMFQR